MSGWRRLLAPPGPLPSPSLCVARPHALPARPRQARRQHDLPISWRRTRQANELGDGKCKNAGLRSGCARSRRTPSVCALLHADRRTTTGPCRCDDRPTAADVDAAVTCVAIQHVILVHRRVVAHDRGWARREWRRGQRRRQRGEKASHATEMAFKATAGSAQGARRSPPGARTTRRLRRVRCLPSTRTSRITPTPRSAVAADLGARPARRRHTVRQDRKAPAPPGAEDEDPRAPRRVVVSFHIPPRWLRALRRRGRFCGREAHLAQHVEHLVVP